MHLVLKALYQYPDLLYFTCVSAKSYARAKCIAVVGLSKAILTGSSYTTDSFLLKTICHIIKHT